MSTFTQDDQYSLEDYDLVYHHPTSTETNATITIVKKSDGTTEASYDVLDTPLGLKISEGSLLVGEADHGDNGQTVSIDFSLNPGICSFNIGTNPSNSRVAGIGIEDLRDASFRWGEHYFYLETEPVNISCSSSTGLFQVEMRDLSTYATGNPTWYDFVEVPAP